MTALSRRRVIAGAAATVAAAALPAAAVANPAPNGLVVEMPVSWYRRWFAHPGLVDGAPLARVGMLVRTNIANEVSRLWLRATEEDHAGDFSGYWLSDGRKAGA
jgi:hypothetical protein